MEDNGCGLSPDVVARAFEPLFTTKPAGRGTGLGLPLCRTVVASHGGRIRLEPLPGGGARATVWLLDRSEPLTSGMSSSLQILVIDDEPAIRQIRRHPTRAGHSVEIAAAAAKA